MLVSWSIDLAYIEIWTGNFCYRPVIFLNCKSSGPEAFMVNFIPCTGLKTGEMWMNFKENCPATLPQNYDKADCSTGTSNIHKNFVRVRNNFHLYLSKFSIQYDVETSNLLSFVSIFNLHMFYS